MIDKLFIGPVPCNEECEQVGDNYDPSKARAECNRFINLIVEKMGVPPEGASLLVARESHDFGSYYEVAVRFDDSYPDAIEWAFNVEANAPMNWEG
jgi:hypothetical protein